jgi:uncharacterized protein (TIGR03067 family)
MKRHVFRALALVVCIVAPSCPGTPDDNAKLALQGKWRAIEATSNGEPPPPGMLERLTLVFRGDTVSIMGAPPTRFTLDTTVTPARIDILNSRHQVGIYELKDSTLRVCFGMDGDRPQAFHTKPQTDHTYMKLQRMQ